MKTPFKVGDRVAVFGHTPRVVAGDAINFSRRGYRGNVSEIVSEDEIVVQFDTGGAAEVHPKQCRRLVKKPRRRLYAVVPTYAVTWVDATYDKASAVVLAAEQGQGMAEVREFVEARGAKGKKS